jgi:hypothetical protein
MSQWIEPILITSAAVIAGLILAILLIPLIGPMDYRRRVRISVSPTILPTTESDVPPAIRAMVARAVPALTALQFRAVANVHAPRFGTTMRWTQVLFIRRDAGDRVSVISLQIGKVLLPSVIFATEFADGHIVRTPYEGPLEAMDLDALYRQHQSAVGLASASHAGRLLPPPGDEVPWLCERANLVAASVARRVGFELDPTGQWYIPPWSLARKHVWQQCRRRFTPRWLRKKPSDVTSLA